MLIQPLVLIGSALFGVLIGVLSGMLGIGGGTIMVPAFRLAWGMSAIASTATSLFAIVPTSISGAISHIRAKTCVVPLGIAAGLGGACTSPVGVWLATKSPSWLIMAVAAAVVGYSAVTMLRKAMALPPAGRGKKPAPAVTASVTLAADEAAAVVDGAGSTAADATSEPAPASVTPAASGVSTSSASAKAFASSSSAKTPAATSPANQPADVHIGPREFVIGIVIGLIAGLASGYVGVGGGFIMVPLMLAWVGIPMKKASGTSLIGVMILAVPGVIEQGMLGNIDYLTGALVALGSIPGAVIGASLVRIMPERILRFVFGGFLVFAAIVLVLNEAGFLC